MTRQAPVLNERYAVQCGPAVLPSHPNTARFAISWARPPRSPFAPSGRLRKLSNRSQTPKRAIGERALSPSPCLRLVRWLYGIGQLAFRPRQPCHVLPCPAVPALPALWYTHMHRRRHERTLARLVFDYSVNYGILWSGRRYWNSPATALQLRDGAILRKDPKDRRPQVLAVSNHPPPRVARDAASCCANGSQRWPRSRRLPCPDDPGSISVPVLGISTSFDIPPPRTAIAPSTYTLAGCPALGLLGRRVTAGI